jgi:hypothetical protein
VVVVLGEPDPEPADFPAAGDVVGLPDPVDVLGPCEVGPLLVGAVVVTCGALVAPAPFPCADRLAVIATAVITVKIEDFFISGSSGSGGGPRSVPFTKVAPLPGSSQVRHGLGIFAELCAVQVCSRACRNRVSETSSEFAW